jgi:hypothetical protein
VSVFQSQNNCIYIDGYYNKELIESFLSNNSLKYDYILPCNSFIKIVTSFNNEQQIQKHLHQAFLKGII